MDTILMIGTAAVPAVAAFSLALVALTQPRKHPGKSVSFETNDMRDVRRLREAGGSDTDENRSSCDRLFWTATVGEDDYQPALREIAGDRSGFVRLRVSAELVSEYDNRLDPNAVRVVIHDQTVGYLSAADAARYRSVPQPPITSCQAKVCGGGSHHPTYGVWLDL